jgi:hypothetical protein
LHYKNISENLYEIFWNKFDEISEDPQVQSLEFTDKFNKIQSSNIIFGPNLKDYIQRAWKATCIKQ